MAKHPIFIRNITHLTDARYFAAMGVDWISIRLHSDPASFSFWHTLRDWIEGLKLAAEIEEDDEMLLSRIIIDAKPEGILANHPGFVHLTGGLEMFVAADKVNSNFYQHGIKVILPYDQGVIDSTSFLSSPPDQIYLESEWNEQSIVELKHSGYAGGFCFHGTPESKTGMKDFSEFDKLLELIREEKLI